MNKTISINLGGRVFNIEEEAYQVLKNYLESIRSNFSGEQGSAEIMSDIEGRIAEIFSEKNNELKNVITKSDIEDMMKVMGKPEEYRVDENEPKQEQEQKTQETYNGSTRNSRRKIFRDQDDAIIAGVCSGLSHYFKVDPLIIRLIVVILTLASIGFPGVLGYIIFWALVPEASTTAEKLQMRGEHVNIENIGKFVNDEAKAAADRVNKFGKSAAQSINGGSREFVRILGRIICILFGLFCLFSGIGLLIGLVAMLTFSEMNFFGFDGNNWDALNTVLFANDGTLYVFVVGAILAMGAPAIALLYAGIKLITGAQGRIKGFAISLTALFIIGVLLLVYGGIKTGREFSSDAELTQSFVLTENVGDTLNLEVVTDPIFIGRTSHHNEFSNLVKIKSDTTYYGEPVSMNFEPTTSRQFKMVIKRKSNGKNMEQAGFYARNIHYNSVVSQDTIVLDPHFSTPRTDLYRGQEVEITIFVPIGKYVNFGKNTSLLHWYGDEGKVMQMDEDGFSEHEEIEGSVHISEPEVKVTDDSVIIKTGNVEIKTTRD